jgi:YHS domain-containing protein
MKKLFVLVAAALFVSCLAMAQESVKMEAAPVAVEADKPVLIVVGNKVCPVSGAVIPADALGKETVAYNGKVYNLCCPSCKETFLKEADKYAKIAEAEAAVPVQAEAAPAVKMEEMK